ncbi:MAG: DUF975 family protein [Lachnospiraceae bacterium]|nr:DUF975 family protein [Lachnospiraceae bacterium]
MCHTNAELKIAAKNSLRGHWFAAITMRLIMFLISSISLGSNYSDSVIFLSLVISLLNIWLEVGLVSFYFKLCCGQGSNAGVADFLYAFKNHPIRFLGNYLMQILYMLPGTIIYFIGIFIASVFFLAGSDVDTLMLYLYGDIDYLPDISLPAAVTAALLVFVIVLTLAYVLYAAWISLTYSQTTRVLVDFPDLTVTQAYKRSSQLMKGNRLRLLGLQLSFIPWSLLSVVTLGIGFLYLLPYMGCTNVEFYLNLVKSKSTAQ